jgi:hypothetical protein
MVIAVSESGLLVNRSKLAAADQRDELVPFSMTEPNDVVGLSDFDAIDFDRHFWAGVAIRTQTELDGFHLFVSFRWPKWGLKLVEGQAAAAAHRGASRAALQSVLDP